MFLCSDNKGGPNFGAPQDALLHHGVSLPQMLRTNVVLRELDISFNGLSSDGGSLILDALVDNHCIRKLCLRGNTFDDDVADALGEFLQYNNVVEEFDIGDNRLGYASCLALAKGTKYADDFHAPLPT